MNPVTPDTTEPHPFSKAAIGWMSALVLGIAIAAGSAVRDRAHRRELETLREKTSVGDKLYFPLAERGTLKLRFAGEPLVLSSETPDPMPESRMVRVGETEAPRYPLYVPSERANGNGEVGGPSWYLKTGPGEFLRATR
ncbi:MAG: hypothetical protein RLZZ399_1430 [Verrucomicrobiota bacterium]|jgi:hypothetical protein